MTEIDGHVRHYVDTRFADHQKEHRAEHRAVVAAHNSLGARLQGVNEFRQSLTDQSRTFVTRDVLDAALAARDAKIESLQGSSQRSAVLSGIAAGVVGVIGGLRSQNARASSRSR